VDAYFEQKVAERDGAKTHCDYLAKKYDEAAEKFYNSGDNIYLRDCFTIGDVLMDARERLDQLEAIIAENQARIEEEEPSYEEQQASLVVYNPYTYLTFNRFSVYTYLVLMGLIGIAVFVASAVNAR